MNLQAVKTLVASGAALFVFSTFLEASTFQPGDVFVSDFFNRTMRQYRESGKLVQSFTGTGALWLGAAVISNTHVATTRRSPANGINIFDSAGNETTFDTPEVAITGDVSVFADGTLAISDQEDHQVELYSQAGNYLGHIAHPIMDHVSSPFGSAIGPDDTLWVALFNQGVARFSRAGSFLGSFNPFSVQDIAVDPADGTLWIPKTDGSVHHFTAKGIEISSFNTAATPNHMSGIAVLPDQSIYVTSLRSDSVFRYGSNGDFLGSFEDGGRKVFIGAVIVPEPSALMLFVMACVGYVTISRL